MKLSEFKPTEAVLARAGKCTTAEEVEKLAQEYDVELTAEEIADVLEYNSIRELNDDQLNQVAGGDDWEDKKSEYLPRNHGRHIGKYEAEAHIGERVYCVQDSDPKQFGWGILERSYEIPCGLWHSQRVHNIRMEGRNHDTDQLCCVGSQTIGIIKTAYKNIPVGQVMPLIISDKSTLFLYNK